MKLKKMRTGRKILLKNGIKLPRKKKILRKLKKVKKMKIKK
jgi:hypothetical protein